MELAVPDPPLSDSVVTLRPPQDDDLGAIGRGIAYPDVARWIGPFDSAREVLERNLSRWAAGTRATFSICDQEEACVGHVWLILADPEDSDRGSVGYWLLPEARGVGFATRSVQLISRWALGDLGLARLSLSLSRRTRNLSEWHNGVAMWKRAFFGRTWGSAAGVSIASSSRCSLQTSPQIFLGRSPCRGRGIKMFLGASY